MNSSLEPLDWRPWSDRVGFPARGREYVLVALVPAAQHDFTSVRFILFNGSVVAKPDVLVGVEKANSGPSATSLGYYNDENRRRCCGAEWWGPPSRAWAGPQSQSQAQGIPNEWFPINLQRNWYGVALLGEMVFLCPDPSNGVCTLSQTSSSLIDFCFLPPILVLILAQLWFSSSCPCQEEDRVFTRGSCRTFSFSKGLSSSSSSSSSSSAKLRAFNFCLSFSFSVSFLFLSFSSRFLSCSFSPTAVRVQA